MMEGPGIAFPADIPRVAVFLRGQLAVVGRPPTPVDLAHRLDGPVDLDLLFRGYTLARRHGRGHGKERRHAKGAAHAIRVGWSGSGCQLDLSQPESCFQARMMVIRPWGDTPEGAEGSRIRGN